MTLPPLTGFLAGKSLRGFAARTSVTLSFCTIFPPLMDFLVGRSFFDAMSVLLGAPGGAHDREVVVQDQFAGLDRLLRRQILAWLRSPDERHVVVLHDLS